MKVKFNKQHKALLTTALSASVALAFAGAMDNAGITKLVSGADVAAFSSAKEGETVTPSARGSVKRNISSSADLPYNSNGYWVCYYSKYERDVKFNIAIVNGKKQIDDPGRFQLGIFIDGECRGISQDINWVGGYAVYGLRAWTNDNLDGAELKLVDNYTGEIYDLVLPEFEESAMVGTIDKPLFVQMASDFNKPYNSNGVWKFYYSKYENFKTAYIGFTNPQAYPIANLSSYQLGAFVGDECRGFVSSIIGPDGRGQFPIRIWYNDSLEDVSFKLYNIHTGKIYDVPSADLSLDADMIGSIDEPAFLASDLFDLNDMIINPSFHNGFNGWNYRAGNVGGFASNPSVEVYENIVDCWQVIEGVPDGIYTLSCQAFERPANNGNYNGSEDSKVFLYMNDFMTPVQNIVDDALPEDEAEHLVNCYLVEGDEPSDDYILGGTPNSLADYSGHESGYEWGYVPNSMPGASIAFKAGRYNQKVYGIVEGGKLKIGLTSNDQIVHWVLWANFHIEYEGKTREAVEAIGSTFCQQALKYIKSHEMTYPGVDALHLSIDAVDSREDVDTMYEKIIELNAAIASARENHEVLMAAISAKESMEQTADEFYETTSIATQKEFDEAVAIDLYDYTTEELRELIVKFEAISSRLRVPAFDDASDNSPLDCSRFINNADMEEGANSGWFWGKNCQNGPELISGFDGTQSAEFWNPVASEKDALGNVASTMYFDFYQYISGLPTGRYTLAADASNSLNGFIYGGQSDLNENGRAFIYAEVQDSNGYVIETYYSDPVRVTEEAAIDDYDNYPVTFDIKNPEATVRIGFTTVGDQTARWFVADNFSLTYYGKDSQMPLSPTEAILQEDINAKLDIHLHEGWTWMSVNNNGASNSPSTDLIKALDAEYIATQDVDLYNSGYTAGSYFWLNPSDGLKVKRNYSSDITVRGIPFNLDENPICLYSGWTWISYLPQNAQSVESAFRNSYIPEGSIIKGQNGFAVFANNKWVSTTNFMLTPGDAYKFYNADSYETYLWYAEPETSASVKSRSNAAKQPLNENWTYNQYQYANIMSVIATTPDNDRYRVAAFVGNECRGVSDMASDRQLLNVVGAGANDRVSFQLLDTHTGEILDAKETVDFNSSSCGTFKAPLILSVGQSGPATAVKAIEGADAESAIYTLQGVKINKPTVKGTYIINGKKVIIK